MENVNTGNSSTSVDQLTTPTYQNLFGSDSYYTVPPHWSALSTTVYIGGINEISGK